MDKIKSELTAITEKYKKDFEAEINGDKVFETILDVYELIDKYKIKLKHELLGVSADQLKYIDKSEEAQLTEFIRGLLISFLSFAKTFL
jgi:hypothetical protein